MTHWIYSQSLAITWWNTYMLTILWVPWVMMFWWLWAGWLMLIQFRISYESGHLGIWKDFWVMDLAFLKSSVYTGQCNIYNHSYIHALNRIQMYHFGIWVVQDCKCLKMCRHHRHVAEFCFSYKFMVMWNFIYLTQPFSKGGQSLNLSRMEFVNAIVGCFYIWQPHIGGYVLLHINFFISTWI